ncbi:MAG: exodeoxyribonuclease III [Gammaproteobacteria bacterium]|nr:exodeoxyribonuclease III [Gammaproteobacteria bacterium]MDA7994828.1 exodeoxyribonuclease III [Gammaproteobacteria bacterium]MDA8024694.1 exodeoxyribonuclease III [Gammaproteobacteria bacterium]
MKIITWNVNGIRAVERKGELQKLVKKHKPDVLMLQEVKGEASQFGKFLCENPAFHQRYHSAEKRGYAGTGMWVAAPLFASLKDAKFGAVIPGAPNADEGRLTQLSFSRGGEKWELLSIYFPNGGKSEKAWEEKLVFYRRTLAYMNKLRKRGAVVLVGGDMNVAHNEIDLARPKDNDGKIGFHPKERAWMDRVVADGWADVWRARNPDARDVYSWWHMISRARARNVGWRIDYFLLAREHLSRVGEARYLDKQMGSDHCPLLIEMG